MKFPRAMHTSRETQDPSSKYVFFLQIEQECPSNPQLHSEQTAFSRHLHRFPSLSPPTLTPPLHEKGASHDPSVSFQLTSASPSGQVPGAIHCPSNLSMWLVHTPHSRNSPLMVCAKKPPNSGGATRSSHCLQSLFIEPSTFLVLHEHSSSDMMPSFTNLPFLQMRCFRHMPSTSQDFSLHDVHLNSSGPFICAARQSPRPFGGLHDCTVSYAHVPPYATHA